MAINKQTLKTRALTALIFVLLVFAGLFINAYGFIILLLAILGGCLYEFNKVGKLINIQKKPYFFPLAFCYIVIPIAMLADLGLNGNEYTHQAAQSQGIPYRALLPVAIFFSLWINDTMAYLVGSMIGRTPFSKISPKKTWEGTIGGAILCVVSMGLLGRFIPGGERISWQHWVHISGLCAIFGTLGDLFESWLKRKANIKDSGQIMPGHGGFLDRFDSLLGATPMVWIYIKLFL